MSDEKDLRFYKHVAEDAMLYAIEQTKKLVGYRVVCAALALVDIFWVVLWLTEH